MFTSNVFVESINDKLLETLYKSVSWIKFLVLMMDGSSLESKRKLWKQSQHVLCFVYVCKTQISIFK